MSEPLFGRLVVVGLGLIGGSFAKGMRAAGLFREVVGVEQNVDNRTWALQLSLVDRCAGSLEEAVQGGVDVIQLAVPLSAMPPLLAQLAALPLKKDVLITDVGSDKRSVLNAAFEAFGCHPSHFVPAHPIAGSEQSGPAAADAELFKRHKVIITPLAQTSPEAVMQVSRLWQALGAEVQQMEPYRHDATLAATSHLPHMLAFVLTEELSRRGLLDSRIAGGGLRDVSRIAASDPLMWRDIALSNADCLLTELGYFREALDRLSQLVERRDEKRLFDLFRRAKAAREALFPKIPHS